MRGRGLGAEVVLVPVGDQDGVDNIVGWLGFFKTRPFVGRARLVRCDPISRRSVDEKARPLDADEHPGVSHIAQRHFILSGLDPRLKPQQREKCCRDAQRLPSTHNVTVRAKSSPGSSESLLDSP
jgi:hypothetical protein